MVFEDKLTRLFVCFDFPDEIIKEIARIQEIIENKLFIGKLTELENLHLTLKFLGEVDSKKLESIRKELSMVKCSEFEAKLGNIGLFNYNGNPKIIWLKVLGKGVFELQKKIDSILESNFKAEERFMSHLTIARIKYVKDKFGFKEYIKNISTKNINFTVKSFKLMKSDLYPQGPVYSIVGEYSLEKVNIDKKENQGL